MMREIIEKRREYGHKTMEKNGKAMETVERIGRGSNDVWNEGGK